MKKLLSLIVFCGFVTFSKATCHKKDELHICTTLDYDYPTGIESIFFVLSDIGILKPTSFTNPKLQSVKSLTFGGGRIRTIESGTFQGFPELTSLLISNNDLQMVSPSWFNNPAAVEMLNVTSNRMNEVDHQMLAGFTALRTLNFENNSIATIRSGSFKDLSRLSYLDLSFNKISHLESEVLGHLQNASFRLDGNPWNCSCALKNFAIFLQELRNESRLVKADSVTCHNPPDLRGTSVWDVSFVNCTSPDVEETPAEVSLHVILPALLVVLVIFLFIFLLWKKIQDKKQVQPDGERGGTKATSHAGKKAVSGTVKPAKVGVLNMEDFVTVSKNTGQKGRSKSASAILLNDYGLQTNSSLCKKKTEERQASRNVGDTKNKEFYVSSKNSDGNVELWYYNSLQSGCVKNITGNAVSVSGTHAGVNQNPVRGDKPYPPDFETYACLSAEQKPVEVSRDLRLREANTDNLEPLVYLSVHTSSEEPLVNNHRSQKVAHKSTLKPRPLRRTYTWPHEKTKSSQESDMSHENFLKSLNLSPDLRAPRIMGQQAKDQGVPSRDGGHRVDTFDRLPEGKDPSENKIFNEQRPKESSPKPKNKEESKCRGGEQSSALSARRVYQRSNRNYRSRRNRTSPETGIQREDLNSQDSLGRSNLRTTPDDDTLLENNEYNFMNLLHEVVENHGRWTRARWRQIHQQRAVSRSPPMS